MDYISVLIVVLILMFLAPFVGSLIYCFKKKGKVLWISQEKKKDARYFGKAFSRLVEKGMEKAEDNTIMLSQKETFIDGDNFDASKEEINEIIICREKDFVAPKEVKVFDKEIYSADSIVLPWANVTIRAAYAKKKMVLKEAVNVDRWVDAEDTMIIYDNCNLGMSATAGNRLSIGRECKFHRLFAPEIMLGQYPEDVRDFLENKIAGISEALKQPEIKRKIKVVDMEMVNEKKEADITILTDKELTIVDGVIVKGDICSHKGVRLCDNTVVCGNIFAEEDIHIGSNAVVLGNIFTQGNVFIEKNAMIGCPGKIVSMVARESIFFDRDICVFGFVSCEGGGSTAAKDEKEEDEIIPCTRTSKWYKTACKKLIKALACMIIVIVFTTICILTECKMPTQEKTDICMQNTMEKDWYNGYGLLNGTKLSDELTFESDSLICYEDRILRKPCYDEKNAERIAAITEAMLTSCPRIENIYVLPVPNRIVLEKGYEEEKAMYDKYMDTVSKLLPQKATAVNVLPKLEEHREEYIFYRTEDFWTAKGAYYGMEVLCDIMGMENIGLNQYEEHMYNSFFGSLTKHREMSGMSKSSIPKDMLYYYYLPGSLNRVEITDTNDDGKKVSIKKPLITISAVNTGAFIDGSFCRAIVEGEPREEKNKDKKILVVCDEGGKLLVPFLKDYYDGVYVVNIKEDYELYRDINEIADEYNISEVIIAQGADKMGATGYFRALYDFYGKE